MLTMPGELFTVKSMIATDDAIRADCEGLIDLVTLDRIRYAACVRFSFLFSLCRFPAIGFIAFDARSDFWGKEN